jgi:hypothetical protein
MYVGTLVTTLCTCLLHRIFYLIHIHNTETPVVELQCEEVPFARVLTLNCSSAAGPVVAATCSFDGFPPISCELNNEAACLTSSTTLSTRLFGLALYSQYNG